MGSEQGREKGGVHRRPSRGRNGEFGGVKEFWRHLN